jgi:DNA-binding transcriptional regulator/RsmH inhibitor MraZ
VSTITRSTDDKGRVSLPKSFANATVLIEQVSETELRIRKARVIPEDSVYFVEDSARELSVRDRDVFLSTLADPPAPSASLKRAIAKYKGRGG